MADNASLALWNITIPESATQIQIYSRFQSSTFSSEYSFNQNKLKNTLTITTINDTKIISIPANLQKGKKYIIQLMYLDMKWTTAIMQSNQLRYRNQ